MDRAPQLFLSRTAGGTYLLTRLPPIVQRIEGTDRFDVFERPGEPVAVRHLCPQAMHAMYRIELAPLETIRVRLAIDPVAATAPPMPAASSGNGTT